MKTEIREQIVGAITLVMLAVFLVVLNRGSDPSSVSGSATEVEALFGRIDGLGRGDEVRMGGIRIGTVLDQRLDQEYHAVVTMSLDTTVLVPNDSSAAVQTDGLFGGKFIVIQPGIAEDGFQNGDRITDTQDAQVVGDLLETIISEGRAALTARQNETKPE